MRPELRAEINRMFDLVAQTTLATREKVLPAPKTINAGTIVVNSEEIALAEEALDWLLAKGKVETHRDSWRDAEFLRITCSRYL